MSSRRIARRNAKKLLLEQQMEALQIEEAEQKLQEEEEKRKSSKPKGKIIQNKPIRSIIPTDSDYQLKTDEVLDLYTACFEEMFVDLPLLQERIQTVKQDLYNRDYISAFNDEMNRLAYVVRWSPLRSLGYSSLFIYLNAIRELFVNSGKDMEVLSIGGGAGSELVAFASCFAKSSLPNLTLKLVDIADWSSIIETMSSYIDETWIHEEKNFNPIFIKQDILQDPTPELTYPNLNLITLLFTTNELFKENKSLSINLLSNFNKYCQKGCLLLITESAGSYSEIQIGAKTFPIQFLVDMILCGKPGDDKNRHWEIIDQNDSIWYRLPNDLEYDLKLENMRCFYRLYRKL